MAVTTSINPQYVQYTDSTGHLAKCVNGGEDYRSLPSDTSGIFGDRLAIRGWYGDNISSACTITHIKVSAKIRTRTKSNGWTSLKSDCYFYPMPMWPKGIPTSGTVYDPYSWRKYDRIRKTADESSDWKSVEAESDVTVSTPARDCFPCVELEFMNGNQLTDVRCYIKGVAITATRTRACYITFKGDGITEKTTMYDYGTVPSFGSTPTRSGYIFKGWSDGSTTYSGTLPTAYEQDVTYTAVWAADYTVTYDVNGATSGSIANATAYRDTDFSLPTGLKKQYTVTMNPNYSGATVTQAQCSAVFNGWEDHGTITASNGKTFTKDTFDAPLYANSFSDLYNAFKYNKQALVNHWVNYGVNESHRFCTGSPRGVYNKTNVVSNLADAKGSTTLFAQWGDMSAVTLPTLTRDKYTFLGWYTASSGGTRVGGGGTSYTPTGNITLYAHWKLNEITDIYIGTSILDVYVGTSKLDAYQGTTKIYG